MRHQSYVISSECLALMTDDGQLITDNLSLAMLTRVRSLMQPLMQSHHYLPYDRGDLEYYDDSVVKMSQTAHDSAACQIARCGLEALRRHHLHVAHVIDRQAALFGAELGEHDGPVVCARRSREPSRQIDYRDDGAAEVDQSADVRR